MQGLIVQFAKDNSDQRSGAKSHTRNMPRTKSETYRIFRAAWPHLLRRLVKEKGDSARTDLFASEAAAPTRLQTDVQQALQAARAADFDAELEEQDRYDSSMKKHLRQLHIQALRSHGTTQASAETMVDSMHRYFLKNAIEHIK